MPRNGRGGRRQGTPGKAYSNRTDLQATQPVRTPTGMPYGTAQALTEAQRAVPLPQQTSSGAGAAPFPPAAPAPGAFGPLDAPTNRPDEPLTAGMRGGPGPGPEAIVRPMGLSPQDQLVAQLRGLYAAYPNRDVLMLLDAAERQAASGG